MSRAVLHLDTGLTLRGGQRQVLLLMRALRDRGWRNTLAAPPDSTLAQRAAAEGFALLPFAPRNDLDLVAAWRLGRAADEAGLDLWHAHSARAHSQARLALSWPLAAPRRRLVVTRRNAFRGRTGLSHRIKYRDERVSRYVAISRAVAEGLAARGVSLSRIQLVPDAVDPAVYAAAAQAQLGDQILALPSADPSLREQVRQEFGFPPDAFVVGAAGALDPSKGHDLLLRAASRASIQEPRLHVVIAGEGPERDRLASESAHLGMGEHFRLLGQRGDVPRLLAGLDLFCMPSREEGLGSAVLEAFAAGVPVLASDAGGLAELLQPGVTGRRVPRDDLAALAEALLEAVRSPEHGRAMALNAYQCAVKQFSTGRMAEAMERIYDSLGMDGDRPRAAASAGGLP